jgi:RNA polymerase sigma-70 factor (ECF subfamily)
VSVSLDQLVREQYAMVLSFCTMLMGGRADAEDLAQEVFLVACRRSEVLDDTRPPGPWLRGVARNLARNAARRRHPVFYLSDGVLEWLDGVYRRIEARPGQGWSDRLDALRECLAALAETDRRYVSLHYFQGHSYREISGLLDTSVANVRKRLYRVRRRLADCVLRRLEVSDA